MTVQQIKDTAYQFSVKSKQLKEQDYFIDKVHFSVKNITGTELVELQKELLQEKTFYTGEINTHANQMFFCVHNDDCAISFWSIPVKAKVIFEEL